MSLSNSTEKSTRSNYDRWKPGTKLACMMALKRIGHDPNFFDTSNNKYNSLTWHTVAESLNKEYPDYAKRFTNINVKDRFDRVLKHHKVLIRMANQQSGFVWNPKIYCFDQNDDLIKEYEKNIRVDEIIKSELNVARFLCKPGHIDLEYYHRYIYQIKNEDELRNDTILNSPSYIEEAISKGILTNLSARPAFFKDPSSGSHGSTSTNISDLTPTGGSNDSSVPLANTNQSPINDSHSSLPPPLTTTQLKPQKVNSQTPQQAVPPQPQPIQHPMMSPHTHAQQPQLQQHLTQSNSNLMSMSAIHPPPDSLPPSNQELDFSGLIDNQSGLMNTQMAGLPMIGTVNTEENNSKHHQGHQQHQPPPPPPQQFIHPHQHPSQQVQHQVQAPSQHGQQLQIVGNTHQAEPPRKRLRTSLPHSVVQSGIMVDSYETLNSSSSTFTQSLASANNTTFSDGSKPLTSGEAVLQIHKEFEIMKSAVSEEILQLRMNKILSYEDFLALQHIQENNATFIRSAYKRVRDDEKLMDLIAVYLNKI